MKSTCPAGTISSSVFVRRLCVFAPREVASAGSPQKPATSRLSLRTSRASLASFIPRIRVVFILLFYVQGAKGRRFSFNLPDRDGVSWHAVGGQSGALLAARALDEPWFCSQSDSLNLQLEQELTSTQKNK